MIESRKRSINRGGRSIQWERFLIELSGDLPLFGLYEVESILKAYNCDYHSQLIDNEKNLVLLETNPIGGWLIARRAAFVKGVYRILGSFNEIDLEELVSTLLHNYRIHLFYRSRGKKNISDVLDKYKNMLKLIKYEGKKPYKEIKLTLDKIGDEIYLLEEVGGWRDRLSFRNPKHRSYAPAATMDSFISRALVNFSRVLPGDVFLDPFAGSGSIALEASSVGAFTLASDLSIKHLLGLKLNALVFGFDVKIFVADATRLPLDDASVDAISTDPPYGRSASSFKRGIKDTYIGFLREASRVLKRGKIVSFCSPSSLVLDDLMSDFGFKTLFKLAMRVHRSLGRVIYVITLI